MRKSGAVEGCGRRGSEDGWLAPARAPLRRDRDACGRVCGLTRFGTSSGREAGWDAEVPGRSFGNVDGNRAHVCRGRRSALGRATPDPAATDVDSQCSRAGGFVGPKARAPADGPAAGFDRADSGRTSSPPRRSARDLRAALPARRGALRTPRVARARLTKNARPGSPRWTAAVA